MKLSEEQKEIIRLESGLISVTAKAGSGKTLVLTERVRYLINEKKVKGKILCLTFTAKAAEEMNSRLSDIDKIEDKVFIGTIHEFCMNIIQSKYRELGYENVPHIFESDIDKQSILADLIQDNPEFEEAYINLPEGNKKKYFFSNALTFFSRIKRKLETDLDNDKPNWALNIRLYNSYKSALQAQNAIDYDDVLLKVFELFRDNPKTLSLYKRIYKYICVDEAQDLNFAHFNIIKYLVNDDLLMLGDENQSIYQFNGASPYFFSKRKLEEVFHKEIIIKSLTNNYRSSKKVVELANQLRKDKVATIANIPIEGYVDLQEFDNEELEAKYILDKIDYYLSNETFLNDIVEKVSLDSFVVLARNRYVFNQLITQLKERNLSYELLGSSNGLQFESKFFKAFDLGSRVIINQRDEFHYKQLLDLYRIEYTEETKAINILSDLKKNNEISDFLVQVLVILKEEKSPALIFRSIQKYIGSLDENDKDYELLIGDYEYFKKLWSNFTRSKNYTKKDYHNFRKYITMGYGDHSKVKEQVSLTLSTVHMAKGKEFDVVFLMGMNEGTFPYYSSLNDSKKLDEEKNAAYVAVTRAKRVLHISYPVEKVMPWGDSKKQIISQFFKEVNL
ncbi:ATP-dependent helicase [Flammeovirga sp. SJP92]|uniref:ATP-dependent helicase n=1 Tax=Flammeovirga sp. SJP92 TaxID=1775430 RepID=UPI00078708A4|nr:ATP-dependent helicase [Flammeovirga sp. SJP92]KXX71374.1 hypothetical protein AVL50_05585 [Flammeovirga sp. SJP92]